MDESHQQSPAQRPNLATPCCRELPKQPCRDPQDGQAQGRCGRLGNLVEWLVHVKGSRSKAGVSLVVPPSMPATRWSTTSSARSLFTSPPNGWASMTQRCTAPATSSCLKNSRTRTNYWRWRAWSTPPTLPTTISGSLRSPSPPLPLPPPPPLLLHASDVMFSKPPFTIAAPRCHWAESRELAPRSSRPCDDTGGTATF